MCQTPVGKVVGMGKNTLTVEHKGKLRELRSKLAGIKEGDYVEFSLDIAIDKMDPEEAEMLLGADSCA